MSGRDAAVRARVLEASRSGPVLTQLPEELVTYICSFMTIPGLLKTSSCCRLLNRTCNDEQIWERKCRDKYPLIYWKLPEGCREKPDGLFALVPRVHPAPETDGLWKTLYRRFCLSPRICFECLTSDLKTKTHPILGVLLCPACWQEDPYRLLSCTAACHMFQIPQYVVERLRPHSSGRNRHFLETEVRAAAVLFYGSEGLLKIECDLRALRDYVSKVRAEMSAARSQAVAAALRERGLQQLLYQPDSRNAHWVFQCQFPFPGIPLEEVVSWFELEQFMTEHLQFELATFRFVREYEVAFALKMFQARKQDSILALMFSPGRDVTALKEDPTLTPGLRRTIYQLCLRNHCLPD
eukprot:gnl/Hemi2/22267_TR7411_c0_g1_i1.p1 gnl/Hemi2/22267_TR7411_c0_g1~~gnl/Hemi2/22267_TR7411_c0_g1_i1.p1  ORF type:complete len:363 (-),score=37.38 gnl/Hemi2/22267_TR7411_c0_g1_i1:81-1139(-)